MTRTAKVHLVWMTVMLGAASEQTVLASPAFVSLQVFKKATNGFVMHRCCIRPPADQHSASGRARKVNPEIHTSIIKCRQTSLKSSEKKLWDGLTLVEQ